ncbi:MAG: hypothetical protein HC925_06765 [Coleofasciculaceae cyanobacterium SM2_3_26]|nr:hypothetical protein [Coleofasciculaceae cyanobacterium SM2_3_26]
MATTVAGQGSSAIAAAPARYNGDTYQGITLVLNAGATTTEIALVDIPEHLHDLRYSDFTLHSFPYAGDALDQDIILQLILSESAYLATDICPQPEDMPQPGEPDVALRHRVRHRLQGSAFGQTLMEIAAHLKVVLQYQERYAFDLGEKSRAVTRQELERWVLVPFVQRLNRELNALLSYTRVPVQAIDRAIVLAAMPPGSDRPLAAAEASQRHHLARYLLHQRPRPW